MSKFRVFTLKSDNSGGPVPIVDSTDFEDAADDALARADVIAAGGDSAGFIHEITGTEATDGGFATQATLAALATSADNIDDKLPSAAALSDAASNPTATSIGAAQLQYNGSTFERQRGNTNLTVLANAARIASNNTSDQTNYNGKGLLLFIDVTAITDTPSITVKIQGKDPVSNQYYDILTSAAITTVSTVILRVYPGLTPSANLIVSDILPRTWRAVITHNDADSISYSIGASVIQ